ARASLYFDMAMVARIPRITTTIKSSMSVNPRRPIRMVGVLLRSTGTGRRPTAAAPCYPCLASVAASGSLTRAGDDAIHAGRRGGGGIAPVVHAEPALVQRLVGGRGLPARGGRRQRDGHAAGRREVERRHVGRIVVVVVRIRVVDLLLGSQVLEVRLHGREVGPFTRLAELGDGDRGEDADDDHHDQQLDQREPLTSLDHDPVLSWVEATLPGRVPEEATPVPGSARRGRCGSCHYITMTWRIARSPDGV